MELRPVYALKMLPLEGSPPVSRRSRPAIVPGLCLPAHTAFRRRHGPVRAAPRPGPRADPRRVPPGRHLRGPQRFGSDGLDRVGQGGRADPCVSCPRRRTGPMSIWAAVMARNACEDRLEVQPAARPETAPMAMNTATRSRNPAAERQGRTGVSAGNRLTHENLGSLCPPWGLSSSEGTWTSVMSRLNFGHFQADGAGVRLLHDQGHVPTLMP